MGGERIMARYVSETPLDPAAVAELMAGEQSCGTFTRVAGETDALRARARATVEAVQLLDEAAQPSLPNALLERRRQAGPWHRARIDIAFPPANIGANLPTLASTVAGNLYELGEVHGLRLETLQVPAAYRARFDFPLAGIAGPRRAAGVPHGPPVGTTGR